MDKPKGEWVEIALRDVGNDLAGLPYHEDKLARLAVLRDVVHVLNRAAQMALAECVALIAEMEGEHGDNGNAT